MHPLDDAGTIVTLRSGESFFAAKTWVTPRRIDAILALVAFECLAGVVLLLSSGRSGFVAPWCLFLASGGFLLLATRAALAPGAQRTVAIALLLSFVSHLATLGWVVGLAPFTKMG